MAKLWGCDDTVVYLMCLVCDGPLLLLETGDDGCVWLGQHMAETGHDYYQAGQFTAGALAGPEIEGAG